jgi:DNA-binding NarL/FixJ family response regulator
LVAALGSSTIYEVVAQLDSLVALHAARGRLQCDVALVDIQLTDGSGIEAIRLLKHSGTPPKVVVLTVLQDSATLFAALQAGADGYLVKGSDPRGVLARLGDLLAGEVPMSAAIARRLLDHFRQAAPGRTEALTNLTASETEVLALLAQGQTNQEIAEIRRVALSTVRSQLMAIYAKLQVRNRTEAVALFHRSR